MGEMKAPLEFISQAALHCFSQAPLYGTDMSTDFLAFGLRLKALRMAARDQNGKRLSQEALGERIGVTSQAISNWERGTDRPDTERLPQIAAALGVPISTLFEPSTASLEPTMQFVPVVGECAAGAWFEQDYWDQQRYPNIGVVVGKHPGLRQSAYRVIGNSVDKLKIPDGSFVITVPIGRRDQITTRMTLRSLRSAETVRYGGPSSKSSLFQIDLSFGRGRPIQNGKNPSYFQETRRQPNTTFELKPLVS